MAWHQPLHRTILVVDIEGFNRAEWRDPVRARLRAELHRILVAVLERAGVALERYAISDVGDGALVLVDPAVSKVLLLDPLISELQAGLRDHNRYASARLRLRVALHEGEILPDAHGWSGSALNHAFRLVDERQLRSALRATSEELALIVSEEIYQGVVRHEWRGIRSSEYHHAVVAVKETRASAWIRAPGWRDPPPSEPDRARDAGRSPPGPGGVTNIVHGANAKVFTGPVDVAGDMVIGPG